MQILAIEADNASNILLFNGKFECFGLCQWLTLLLLLEAP